MEAYLIVFAIRFIYAVMFMLSKIAFDAGMNSYIFVFLSTDVCYAFFTDGIDAIYIFSLYLIFFDNLLDFRGFYSAGKAHRLFHLRPYARFSCYHLLGNGLRILCCLVMYK